jgi:DNA-directed RNA polymerase subunit omega
MAFAIVSSSESVSRLYERNTKDLNPEYLKRVLEKVVNPNIVVNLVSRRVRQLSREGSRPLISDTAGMGWADIALLELAEGKLGWEMLEVPPEVEISRKTRRKA